MKAKNKRINDLLKQKEEIALVEQVYEERARIKEERDRREIEQIQESISEREDRRMEAIRRQKSFGEFSSNIKKSLFTEALIALYENSLPGDIKRNPYVKAIGTGMINTFVNEQGVDDILTKTKYNSLFLSEMNRLVNGYHRLITESVDKEGNEFSFDTVYKDKFFEDIKGEDFDELSDAIRLRVSDAVEEFINSNINNKMDVEEIINHTKDKIDNAEYGTSDELKQEMANMAKRRIEVVKNRKYGLLEAIVQNVSKSAMKDEALRENFIDESGKFDMDKIVEASTGIYAFLEMVSTAKIVNVDENYIRSFLESL